MVFIEIFSGISPFMEIHLPLKKAMKESLTIFHVKYWYYFILLSVKKFCIQPKI